MSVLRRCAATVLSAANSRDFCIPGENSAIRSSSFCPESVGAIPSRAMIPNALSRLASAVLRGSPPSSSSISRRRPSEVPSRWYSSISVMADARKAELASFAGVPVTRVDPAGASGLSSIETVPGSGKNIVPNRCASPSRESVTVRRAVMSAGPSKRNLPPSTTAESIRLSPSNM